MDKSTLDSQIPKIAEEVISEFKKQLSSSAEKLEEPTRKLNILIIDSNTIPVKEGYSEFSKIKDEFIEIAAMPFKTLYDSIFQRLGEERAKKFVKGVLENHFSDLNFSAFDLKKEVSGYLSLDK